MTAGLLRRLRSARFTRELIARLAAFYIRVCRGCIRWEIIDSGVRSRIRSGEGRWVLAIWHGRLMMIPSEMHRKLDVRAVISRNRDGDIITRAVGLFGIRTIRGSTHDARKPDVNRGGQDAYRAALEVLENERNVIVALTPDGPRGPRQQCHAGVARISAQAGAVVVPWTFSVRAGWHLGSWDRFLIPRPFCRGVIAYGKPIAAPSDGTMDGIEAHRLEIERALNDLTVLADQRVGRVMPKPEPSGIGTH